MIDDLLNQLVTRFTELTADLRFDYKPDPENKRAPQIIKTMLPYPDQDFMDGQDFPRIRLALYGGTAEDLRKPPDFSVLASGAIWTAGDIEAGSKDIWLLTAAMMNITKNRSFPPFRLRTPCPFRIGDPQPDMEGIQPHPYHFVTMQLAFINC